TLPAIAPYSCGGQSPPSSTTAAYATNLPVEVSFPRLTAVLDALRPGRGQKVGVPPLGGGRRERIIVGASLGGRRHALRVVLSPDHGWRHWFGCEACGRVGSRCAEKLIVHRRAPVKKAHGCRDGKIEKQHPRACRQHPTPRNDATLGRSLIRVN